MANKKDEKVKVIEVAEEKAESANPQERFSENEERMMREQFGIEEEVAEDTQEGNETSAQAEETQETTNAEAVKGEEAEAVTEKKPLSDSDFQKLLSDSFGSQQESNEEADIEAIKAENSKLKKERQIEKKERQVEMEARMIESFLTKLPSEAEREVMDREIEKLFKEGFYAKQMHLSPEERIVFLMERARGRASDSLKEISRKQGQEQRVAESVLNNTSKKPQQTNIEQEELEDLKRRAMDRDEDAMIELAKRDPVIDKFAKRMAGQGF